MLDLIATAYSIADRDLVVGGPAWLERQRFDLAAKAPQETSPCRRPADAAEPARRSFQARHSPGHPPDVRLCADGRKRQAQVEGGRRPRRGMPGEPAAPATASCPDAQRVLQRRDDGTVRADAAPDCERLHHHPGTGPDRAAGLLGFRREIHAIPGAVARRLGRHHGVRDDRTATGLEARSGPRADAGLRRRDCERRADAQSVGRVRGHSVAAADGVRRRRDQAESAGHAAAHAAAARRPHRGRRHHDASDHAARVGHHHRRTGRQHAEMVGRHQVQHRREDVDGGERERPEHRTSTSTISRRCCGSSSRNASS